MIEISSFFADGKNPVTFHGWFSFKNAKYYRSFGHTIYVIKSKRVKILYLWFKI